MSKEMEWWLTEPEGRTLLNEIKALKENERSMVMEFIGELINSRKPP
tara:strand:- start:3763 stop:3903 length:141 start_codon:yes stop_codon:yes gene_type:complete